MCEFISAIRIEGHLLYIDNKTLDEKRTKEILKDSKDNDLLGHHAIRAVYDLKSGEGQEIEVQDFWNPKNLPEELRSKLKDFETFKSNFGKLVTNHAQLDDLEYIIKKAPKTKKWNGLKDFCENLKKDRLMKNVTIIEKEVDVRYDVSIDQLVKEAKFDGYINSNVNDKNFPESTKQAEKKTIKLVNIGAAASTKDIEFVLDALNLRSAVTKELLSLAKDHPDEQRQHPIAALASVWQDSGGVRHVPCVREWADGRGLDLGWLEADWLGGWFFTALSK